ncbi:MAG: glycosyltransferase [Bacteroidales bacterium]|jgi:glycosyltransferase involved in cell wall biosynthesis|nr:glycosyltransferase [Bacteroidales bacterium]
MKITLIGTAYPFRGGLASFNERLMEEFSKEGNSTEINTFTLQYPAIFFPGKTQYANSDNNSKIQIYRNINSINPFNWLKVGKKLKCSKPDIIIIKYWMSFFAPCFGTIARIAKKNNKTKIIVILDNVIPHEPRFFDKVFTKYFVRGADAFIAMSNKVLNDLKTFDNKKPKILTPHPLFDNFGEKIEKQQAVNFLHNQYESIPTEKQMIRLLFFGLIRAYKGLDLLIEALARKDLQTFPLHLVVAGEFYEDSKPYFEKVKKLGLEQRITFINKFIDDIYVKNYFCSSDLLVLPYKDATQSGVTQIAYHFDLPMIVTDVGGLAEIVPDGVSGYVCKKANKDCLADTILKYCTEKPDFTHTLACEKSKYSWNIMTKKIKELYYNIETNKKNCN